jgi:hypothetical protein
MPTACETASTPGDTNTMRRTSGISESEKECVPSDPKVHHEHFGHRGAEREQPQGDERSGHERDGDMANDEPYANGCGGQDRRQRPDANGAGDSRRRSPDGARHVSRPTRCWPTTRS